MDLLDLGAGGASPGPAAAGPVGPVKSTVLTPQTAGQSGSAGFGVDACLNRDRSSGLQLLMTFTNASQASLAGFAIQVNKNPFGIAPGAQLSVPEIGQGSSQQVRVPMNTGQNNSGAPPSNPLFLQVAIK